jgi:hypothetical protein
MTPVAVTLHEDAADYRVIKLSGSPMLIGRAQAAYLRPVGAPFRPAIWEGDTAFLRACARVITSFHAPLWDELAAFADALSLPAERALFVRAGALPHGCSAFAWVRDDGQVIAGRNYDFYERMPTRHLLITQPERGYAHVGMNGGLVGGRYDGMNERGLFVALHKVMADRPLHMPPGVPFHLLPRMALETCATAPEAARLLSAMPHLAAFNYTIADASGACFAVETYPGRQAQLREGAGGIAVANHYESAVLAPLQGQRSLVSSHARSAAMAQMPPPWDDAWDAAMALLAEHRWGMCCHREFGATLWSAVFDLSARRAAYAFGPPCRVSYREIAAPWAGDKMTR